VLTIFDRGIEFWFKAAFLREAALSRGDLTDAQWRILDRLLPDRGERGPEIEDKRRIVNGILWVLRAGAQWRDMPERYCPCRKSDSRILVVQAAENRSRMNASY